MIGVRGLRSSVVFSHKRWLATEAYPQLLRDYLKDCLYAENEGYFSKHAKIGPDNEGNQTPLEFPSLFDEMDYRLKVNELYKKGHGAWLTPVEIFRPWYGKAIAKHILNKCYSIGSGPLEIFEIGGGSGTCMVDVINHIQETEPKLLKTMKYTILEISQQLAAIQRKRAVNESLPAGCWEILNLDGLAIDRILSNSGNASVIALEVLDNLPHDKVIFDSSGEPWQCVVTPRSQQEAKEGWKTSRELLNPILFWGESKTIESDTLAERFEKVSDDLILHCLNILEDKGLYRKGKYSGNLDYQTWNQALHFIRRKLLRAENCSFQWTKTGVPTASSAVGAKMGSVYLPTGQIRLLEMLARCIPDHNIVLADFDAVPGSVVPGANGPAVQVTTQGVIQEMDNYLIAKPGSADIFFPTDFMALSRAYERIVGRPASVVSPGEFFSDFDDVIKGSTTHSGYCPLVEDYVNTAFLVTNH
ncbi:hypothetical protein BSKO_05690 [Bryopsis sp. KO-2023]|nr:hypothetical protein BSKO_05690 [Bryopsis sp. KO-2023]